MVSVIIVMAGSGTRMGYNENKVLLPLANKPIFMHSYDLFKSLGYEVILVVRECDLDIINQMNLDAKIIVGGKSRSESVYNGLSLCSNDIVLVHDAARPFISKEKIIECVSLIDDNNGVFVGKKAVDTIRQIQNNTLVTLDRNSLICAQTPQGAKKQILDNAYILEKENGFLSTDEMSIIEKYSNVSIKVVIGNDENFKITTKSDYAVAKEMVGDFS